MIIVKMRTKKGARLSAAHEAVIGAAAAVVKRGGLVVYPTETLYGIAADPQNSRAMRKLLVAKGRPRGMAISVALSSASQIPKYAKSCPASARLAGKYLPGPLTMVLPSRCRLKGLAGKTLGIRIPSHPIARALIRHAGPVTSTSANLHGGISPAEIRTAIAQLGAEIDIYIDAGRCGKGMSKGSTVIDLCGKKPRILRAGAIPKKSLEETLNADIA